MKEPILSLDEIRSLWLKSTGIEEPCCEWDVLGFAADYESALLEKLCGEPVGEIVVFGQELKEVSWRAGKMPEFGTKLYALNRSQS
ncbi:hypothetical protein [Burkholderia cepacia]|uniref:hypothetical protein n=1 Tax=Burkholderia cepacia TaxID=292 RepID=UPI001F37C529|nr:hypothetical protein [Burkholderia cepacia]MCE4125806.1 hypothetical protein [Burkholderia cepacia]